MFVVVSLSNFVFFCWKVMFEYSFFQFFVLRNGSELFPDGSALFRPGSTLISKNILKRQFFLGPSKRGSIDYIV